MHEDRAEPGRGTHVSATPRSVDELERDAAWQVTRSVPAGDWITAERYVERGNRSWRIGLTPVTAEVAAIILWSGDDVVAHARGREADLCATAHRWISDIVSGQRAS
ncbi:MAG: hypothetical protein ACRDSK_10555 [Actinophytocola sp.]|uniref:hypothetical protein n=1 Tax=Actinophytocola sp. TaxID=1872138 RepID=UPI003D6BAEBA